MLAQAVLSTCFSVAGVVLGIWPVTCVLLHSGVVFISGEVPVIRADSCPHLTFPSGVGSTCGNATLGTECWAYCQNGWLGSPQSYKCNLNATGQLELLGSLWLSLLLLSFATHHLSNFQLLWAFTILYCDSHKRSAWSACFEFWSSITLLYLDWCDGSDWESVCPWSGPTYEIISTSYYYYVYDYYYYYYYYY